MLTVLTSSDALQHTGLSLRDAVAQANADAAGGTSDTIVFDPSLNGGVVTLAQGQLELSGAGAGTITIAGGGQIAVSGNNASRVFQVDSGVQAVLTGLTIEGGTLTGDSGGGILNSGTLTLSHATLSGNSASFGGAIASSSGTLVVSDSTLSGNSASSGGGIDNYSGPLTVSNTTFTGNSASYGGGIEDFSGTLTVSASSFSGNTAAVNGGGIDNYQSTLTVSSTTFTGNSAATGGAVDNGSSTATFSNCTLSDNSASGNGLWNNGTLTLQGTSVAASDTVAIVAGSVTVSASSTIDGSLAMTGGSLTASGTGVTFAVTGSTTVSAASLSAEGGATLSLPGLTTYAGAVGQTTTLQASGAGSELSLPGLTGVAGDTSDIASAIQVNALAGGTVDLHALTQIGGFQLTLQSDGTGSVLNVSALTSLEPAYRAELQLTNGGTVEDGSLTTLEAVSLTLDGTGTGSWNQISSYTYGTLTLTGGTLTLGGLTDARNSTFVVSGTGSVLSAPALTTLTGGQVEALSGGTVDLEALTTFSGSYVPGRLQVSTGGTVEDGSLSSLANVNVTLDGTGTWNYGQLSSYTGGTLTLSGGSLTLPWTDVDGAGFVATGGATLSLPAVTGYTSGTATLDASGTGSVLSLPNLISLTLPGGDGSWTRVEAKAGGTVDLSALPQISGNAVTLQSDGAGSVVNVSALTSFLSQAFDPLEGGGLPSGIEVTNGGTILDGNLSSLVYVYLTLDGTGTWPTSQITRFTDDNLKLTGGTLDLDGVTDADGASFTVSGGASVRLPGVTTYNAAAAAYRPLQASGPGSVLSLPHLTRLTINHSGSSQTNVEALAGGTVDLPALTLIGGDPVTLESDGAGSVLNVPALTSVSRKIGPHSVLQVTNGGTIEDGSLTSLDFVDVTVDGTGTWSLAQVSSYTNGTFTLSGGALTLEWTAVGGSSFVASGGASLSLPALTNYTGATGVFRLVASGTDSVLSLPSLTSLTGSASGGSQAQLEVQSGGTVHVPALASISQYGGSLTAVDGGSLDVGGVVVTIPSPGAGSTIDVPQLPQAWQGWAIDVSSSTTMTGGTTFNVGPGDTVDLIAGTYSGGITFNVAGGATVDLTGGQYTGSVTYSGTLTGSGAGTVELRTGALDIGLGGVTLNCPGSMFQWTGGALEASSGNAINLGTINIAGNNPKQILADGMLDDFGTIIQTGIGDLGLHSDNISPTILKIEPGGQYLMESDGGVVNLFNTNLIDNAGTIRKVGGTSVSPLSVVGSLVNTGTIEADSGRLLLGATTIGQISSTTLTGGTWNALGGATLTFPSGTPITSNAGSITLAGAGARIDGIDGLSTNSGSFTLAGKANFKTAGDFSNSGSLTLGAGSTLSVGGNFTQTSTGTLNVQMAGAPASGLFGQVAVTQTATLGGAFNLALANGFGPSVGQSFGVMSFASATGTFATFSGLRPFFTESQGPALLALNAGVNAVDLVATNVSAPSTATAGQQITVTWEVADQSNQAASGSWQDSVYLSTTQGITSSSILLGTVPQSAGLAANAAYTGSWSGAIPAVFPVSYYLVVQADSLYQVPDSDRSNNTLAANTGPVTVSLPTLTLDAPVSASFTADNGDFYYRITPGADNSILLAVSGSPASVNNALYVSLNTLPTTYQSDYRSVPTAGANPTLAVPTTQGGTYYVLVHHQSGPAGAFTLTASVPGLLVLASSPGTVGNAGQATLTVRGLELEPNTTYTLTGPGGTLTAATARYASSALAYVTFNLTAVTAGTYDLEAVNGGGTTSTLSGAVQVTAGGGPNVVANLITTNPVRYARASVLYVQYANTGNDDAGAPLLTLLSDAGIPISLDANQLPTDPALQVLGINHDGPAGVLPPGATYRFPVYFTAGLNQPFDFELDVADTSDSQALDWDAVEPRIPADVTGAANWPAVFAQLQQMLGSTWGQYIAVLDHYATILPPSVGDPGNPIDVLGLAVNQAVAAVSTSISGVAAGTAPGVLLAGNTITATNGTIGDVFSTNILNDGSFVFPTVTAGAYTFSVLGDLIHGSPPPVTVTAGQAVTGATVTLDPEVILSGQVTAGGVPVAGTDVSVWSAAGLVVDVQADANGNYVATFPAGSCTLVVSAPGLARSYFSVTLAAGPQALNVSLAAESAVSGSVSLSDGQSIQSIDVVAVLHGNEPLPDFSATFTSAAFRLGSLTPGVYDFSISAPGYNPVSIPDVQIGQGQTVNLGAIQLTPVDPVANAVDVALRNTWYFGLAAAFLYTFHCGPSAASIISEYFTGDGVASPFRVKGMVTDSNYKPGSNFSFSTVPNPPVEITDGTDINSFRDNPTTEDALKTTLTEITASGIENLPKVQTWLTPFKTNRTIPDPLTLDVWKTMDDLGLHDLQTVYEDSPWVDLWHFQGGDGISTFLAGAVGSGGPPPPAAAPILDYRIVTGNLVLSLACDGTVTVTPEFHVEVQDTFDFNPASFIAWFRSLGTLAHLEDLDMTADVPFHVEFDGPKIEPGKFWVQPPEPCMTQQPSDCIPDEDTSCNPVTPVRSRDPNALFGPAGYGPQGFIRPAGPLPYTIDFENDGSAAAQDVTVTEQFDPNLDWSTFQLGSFGFGPVNVTVPAGLTQYQTAVTYHNSDGSSLNVLVTLAFNVDTGLLSVTFRSLDPSTGQAPNGVFDGFLYPEDGSGSGSGYVQYTIDPRADLPGDTAITQNASVVFDTNDPLVTNTVLNTIDSGVPSSSVQALAAFGPGQFTVSWSGQDDPGGSGIASYDVYVSDNGAAFTPLLTGTTQTSTTFTGVNGHTYRFYSVATDNVGNVQSMPTVAQASTTVDTAPPSSSVAIVPAITPQATFTLSWSGSDNGGSGIASYDVFVSDNGGPFTALLTGTVQTSVSFTGQNGHTYGFYSVATDNVGNRQPTPTAAQASTLVLALPAGFGYQNGTLTVKGTPGNDTFSFTAGSVYTVTLNRSTYQASPALVHAVVFLGGGGADTANLTDRGSATFVLHPGSAHLAGKGYTVDLGGVKTTNAFGASGGTVTLYDGKGSDAFVSTPKTASLSGGGYRSVASGFARVAAYSTGGKDRATLTGSSGADTFVGKPATATLTGKGYSDVLNRFEVVKVTGGGGSDTATLYDSKGDDTLIASGSTATLSGPGFSLQASKFHKVIASATAGGRNRKVVHPVDYLFEALGHWS